MLWLGTSSLGSPSHRFDRVVTVAALVLVLLAAAALAGAASTRGGRQRAEIRSARRPAQGLWLMASGALLALYCGQELLQGALGAAHPFGLHGLFGHGGWIVVPLALLLGALVAFAVGVVRELERRRGRTLWSLASVSLGRALLPARAPLLLSEPVAENLAGRSPPRLLI